MNGDATSAHLDLSETFHPRLSAVGKSIEKIRIRSRNVIENTGARLGISPRSRDVDENTRVIAKSQHVIEE
jgi:hypothetical protein